MKKLIIITILLVGLPVQAQEVNEEYSFRAFPYHDVSFKGVPAEDFNNTIIRGSCFYQEWRENENVIKDIFPDGMTDVIFVNCNLDNIYIPPGNTIQDGTNKRIQVQNDFQAWILDNDLKPVEPMDKRIRLVAGVSIDPIDIPSKKFTPEERKQFEEQLREQVEEPIVETLPKSTEMVYSSLITRGTFVSLLVLITIFFKRIKLWPKKS